MTALKSRIQAVREEAVAPDLARILDWVASPLALPGANGLAIFACEALDLFEVVALPWVRRTRVMADDTPHVMELDARFFLVRGGSATELEGLVETSRRGGGFHGDRRDAPGWGERDYHNRIRAERHRHCAAIAYSNARRGKSAARAGSTSSSAQAIGS